MSEYILTQDGKLYCMSNDELYHYGIIGMKWGVRRYQNEDGTLTSAGKKRLTKTLARSTATTKSKIYDDDIVIKRGSIQSHVSGNKKIRLNDSETYVYDPSNKHDRIVYEGTFAKYIEVGKRYANQYVHKYAVTEDLVSPSTKKRVDIFIEEYKNNPAAFTSEMNYVSNRMKLMKQLGYNLTEKNENITKYNKEFDANTSSADLKKYGYDTFTAVAELGSKRSTAVKAYYDSIKNKGYNALVDDNNRSVYNDAVQPLIVLNANKTLKELYSYKLDSNDRDSNIEALRDYNEKKYGHRNVAF